MKGKVNAMKDFILKLVEDFNSYSELVALNRAKIEEGTGDIQLLEWNRGSLNKIEEYLIALVEANEGISLIFECKEHTFGFDDWERKLVYRTARVVFDD